MTQEEFINRLKEDKYFEDFEEQYKYRFEAVKYYLSTTIISINGIENIILLQPAINHQQKQLIIFAFTKLKNQFINESSN